MVAMVAVEAVMAVVVVLVVLVVLGVVVLGRKGGGRRPPSPCGSRGNGKRQKTFALEMTLSPHIYNTGSGNKNAHPSAREVLSAPRPHVQ